MRSQENKGALVGFKKTDRIYVRLGKCALCFWNRLIHASLFYTALFVHDQTSVCMLQRKCVARDFTFFSLKKSSAPDYSWSGLYILLSANWKVQTRCFVCPVGLGYSTFWWALDWFHSFVRQTHTWACRFASHASFHNSTFWGPIACCAAFDSFPSREF